jgi:hypothetical protein
LVPEIGDGLGLGSAVADATASLVVAIAAFVIVGDGAPIELARRDGLIQNSVTILGGMLAPSKRHVGRTAAPGGGAARCKLLGGMGDGLHLSTERGERPGDLKLAPCGPEAVSQGLAV